MIRNLEELISVIEDKDKQRILASDKEYCYVTIHAFNAGSYVTIELSNEYKDTEYPEFIFHTYGISDIISKQLNNN